jgi:hypothetical protein
MGFATFVVLTLLGTTAARAQQFVQHCTDDSRRCMIAAATSYLDGLVRHDGSKVLFAPNIVRTEQGRDAGKGEAVLRASLDREPPMLGYGNTRFFVDRQTHQLVYFTLLRLAVDASRQGNPTPGPVTVHLAERFKIEHGLITEIEAVYFGQPGTSEGLSGWPDRPD